MSSILFCTPCYGGMVTTAHFNSCVMLKEELVLKGVPHDWATGRNESLVHRARMEMTAEFLKSEHTHMMWLDADIEFTAEDVSKLWNLVTDIAVAAYSMKLPDKPLSAWKDGKLIKLDECPDKPFPVDFAGTGFMLLRRETLEAVYAHLVAWEYKAKLLVERLISEGIVDGDEASTLNRMLEGMASSYEGPNGRVPALYMTPIHNDGLESEDYFFCRVAREAGFEIIMDPSVKLGHWGQYRYGQ